jgi:hypothetical protein
MISTAQCAPRRHLLSYDILSVTRRTTIAFWQVQMQEMRLLRCAGWQRAGPGLLDRRASVAPSGPSSPATGALLLWYHR